jgi:hypothetical protein
VLLRGFGHGGGMSVIPTLLLLLLLLLLAPLLLIVQAFGHGGGMSVPELFFTRASTLQKGGRNLWQEHIVQTQQHATSSLISAVVD